MKNFAYWLGVSIGFFVFTFLAAFIFKIPLIIKGMLCFVGGGMSIYSSFKLGQSMEGLKIELKKEYVKEALDNVNCKK